MVDAIVLAGGGKDEPLTRAEGVSNKAFIDLFGRPLLGYILDALAGAGSIEQVIVIGPDPELSGLLEQGQRFTPVSEAGSMLENAAAGLSRVDQERPCLLLTGDIPLIEPETIRDFLELCYPADGDFYYPILTRESCRERFPQMERTYVRLRDGSFTGGNMALIRPDWFARSRHRLDQFVAYRKKPLKLLRILPPGLIIKFLFNRLTVEQLESYLSALFLARAHAVPCDLVEIGTDVDKIGDLEVVRQVVQAKKKE
ncbi:MAG: NTP transferase domain-containing protein [Firmicutes bacterium]|jgi:CTP:molybdopterin cytidylyltransferase MocA|nr:NTP transferase domain-containing protein [Bacillota bacterium]